jgi:hypothetical protein
MDAIGSFLAGSLGISFTKGTSIPFGGTKVDGYRRPASVIGALFGQFSSANNEAPLLLNFEGFTLEAQDFL